MHRASPGPTPPSWRPPAPMRGETAHHVGDFTVAAGERVPFVLTWRASHRPPAAAGGRRDALRRHRGVLARLVGAVHVHRAATRDAVQRSLITLKALTYAPDRRDRRRRHDVAARSRSAAPATGTTATAGCATPRSRCRRCSPPATPTRRGLARLAAARRRRRPGATCRSCTASTATRRLPELELPWLPGYEKLAPVRIGNAAADQLQLDVWGEVLDGLYLARQAGLQHADDAWDAPGRPDGTPRDALAASRTTGCGRCAGRSATSPTPR